MNLNSRWQPDFNGTIALSVAYDPSFLSVQSLTGNRIPFVKLTSSVPFTITLPQAIGLFGTGWVSDLRNLGGADVTLNAVTSSIDSVVSVVLKAHQGLRILSDGTNYQIEWPDSSGSGPITPILDTASGNAIFDVSGNWIFAV